MKTESLALNEFYLLVNRSGFYLKTKSKEEFEFVFNWGEILFAGKAKTNNYLFFGVGNTILKKKILDLWKARPQSELWFYDLSELDLKGGNHINKCWIGQKDENYESL